MCIWQNKIRRSTKMTGTKCVKLFVIRIVYVILLFIKLIHTNEINISTEVPPKTSANPQTFKTDEFESNVENNTKGNWNKDYVDMDFLMLTAPPPLFRKLTEEDVEKLLQEEDAMSYISSFETDLERAVIMGQLRQCPYNPLCGFSLEVELHFPFGLCCEHCRCDYPDCLLTKSCCPDILFRNKKLNLSKPVQLQQNCIPLNLPDNFNGFGAFGYDLCPEDSHTDLEHKCTRKYDGSLKMEDIVPVLDNVTMTVYRNRYCAYCHNVSENDLKTYDVNLECFNAVIGSESDMIHNTFTDGHCSLDFYTDSRVEVCSVSITNCNITGLWQDYDLELESACHAYRSVLKTDDYYFQNIFCGICNGVEESPLVCFSESHRQETFSFSGLLNLRSGMASREIEDLNSSCSNDQVYDNISKTCKNLFCLDYAILQDGECVGLFEKVRGMTYSVYMRLMPSQELSITEAYIVADSVMDYLKTISMDTCGLQLVYRSDVYSSLDLDSRLYFFDARLQILPTYFHDQNSVIGPIRKLHNTYFSVDLPFLPRSNVSFRLLLRDDIPMMYDLVSFISETLGDVAFPEPNEINTLPLSTLITQYRLLALPGQTYTEFPHLRKYVDADTCSQPQKSVLRLDMCPRINVTKSENSWKQLDDGSLIFKYGNFKLDSDDFYFMSDSTVAVCAQQYNHLTSTEDDLSWTAETIVSVVCCFFSILCLLITFVIFCIFPNLRRSVPGKNSMSLVFTLMLAQCLYLVSSVGGIQPGSKICKIVGILVHFFWLVAIFWMNVCTYHMFRVLARTKVMTIRSGLKRLLLYHLYALTMAAIFVSINIVVSNSRMSNFGYGAESCYISTQEMIIYTFCIPVAFVVLSNIVMFLYVIVSIRKRPAVQKNVQNERNDLVVFVKLSTITGATWVFGIVNIWLNFAALSYIFIVLNASQGVFIMFAFVVNRRVLDLFRKRAFGQLVTSTGETTRSSVSRNS